MCHFLLYMYNSSGVPGTAQNNQAEEGGCECKQEDFMNDVAAIISSSWRIFGICLGIDNEKLRGVATQNNNDQNLCFADVYSIWKSENRQPVTWTVVVRVLESNLLQKRTLANELKQKYHIT